MPLGIGFGVLRDTKALERGASACPAPAEGQKRTEPHRRLVELDPQHADAAINAVSGQIYNCYSDRDQILRGLYKTANAFTSDPIGLGPIKSRSDKIVNADVSDLVAGHTLYKPELRQVLERIGEPQA